MTVATEQYLLNTVFIGWVAQMQSAEFRRFLSTLGAVTCFFSKKDLAGSIGSFCETVGWSFSPCLRRLTVFSSACLNHSVKSLYSMTIDILSHRNSHYHLSCDWSEDNENALDMWVGRNNYIPRKINLNNTNAVGVLPNISGESWGTLEENEPLSHNFCFFFIILTI